MREPLHVVHQHMHRKAENKWHDSTHLNSFDPQVSEGAVGYSDEKYHTLDSSLAGCYQQRKAISGRRG